MNYLIAGRNGFRNPCFILGIQILEKFIIRSTKGHN